MDDDKELSHPISPSSISWLRAILSAVAILVVGVAVLVYGANAVLTMHGKTRSSLVGIVTPLFFVVLFALAWGLSRLQARKVI
jgi:hypothetical protein